MTRYMLDTNVASYIIKGQYPEIRQRLVMLPADSVVVSAVTQGELYYGVACKGHQASLSQLVHEFLSRLEVLPWDEEVGRVYGDFRATCTKSGITLSALDMMIAAHSVATQCTLVTHDQAFSRILNTRLITEDWIVSS